MKQIFRNKKEIEDKFSLRMYPFPDKSLDEIELCRRTLEYAYPHRKISVERVEEGIKVEMEDEDDYGVLIRRFTKEFKYRAWYDPMMYYTNKFSDGVLKRIDFARNEVTLAIGWGGQHEQQVSMDDPKFILMRFTGMTDRHGVDIWEGDLVNSCPELGQEHLKNPMWRRCIIVFDQYSGTQYYAHGGINPEQMSRCSWEYDRNVEVVGNLFETPKLARKCSCKHGDGGHYLRPGCVDGICARCGHPVSIQPMRFP